MRQSRINYFEVTRLNYADKQSILQQLYTTSSIRSSYFLQEVNFSLFYCKTALLQNQMEIHEEMAQLLNKMQAYGQSRPSLSLLMDILNLISQRPQPAISGLSSCLLKIFRQIIINPKRSTDLFQKLFQRLFKIINDQNQQRKNKIIIKQQTNLKLVQNFVQLLSRGMLSPQNHLRLFSGRCLFQILKPIPQQLLKRIHLQLLDQMGQSVISLLPTMKQLFIKIASLIQEFIPPLKNKLQVMSRNQQNDNIRKLAFSNLNVKDSYLITQRIRDRSKDIRIVCIKKLKNMGIKMQIQDNIRIMFNCMNAKQKEVTTQYINYILQTLSKEHPLQMALSQFLQSLRIQSIMYNPILYKPIQKLVEELIQKCNKKQITEMVQRLSFLLNGRKKSKTKTKQLAISSSFIFILRVASKMAAQGKQIVRQCDECLLTGLQLSQMMNKMVDQKKLFGFYQIIQMIKKPVSMDEIGKQNLLQTLLRIIPQLTLFSIEIYLPNQRNSVLASKQNDQLQFDRVIRNTKQQPIITRSVHLIRPIVQLIKKYGSGQQKDILVELAYKLKKDFNQAQQSFGLRIKAIQNNKKRHTQQARNKRNQPNSHKQILIGFQNQVSDLSKQRQFYIQRLLNLVHSIGIYYGKIPDINLSQLIKEYQYPYLKALYRQANGLFLLENRTSTIKNFSQIAQSIISSKNQFILIDLQIVSDMISKYDLLRDPEIQSDTFNSDIFVNALFKLFFNQNSEIRNMTVEVVCKLLYLQKLPQPQKFFVGLLILWFDSKTNKEGGMLGLQIITIFIKTYPIISPMGKQYLVHYYELFFSLLNQIDAEDKRFNQKYINYNFQIDDFLARCIKIALQSLGDQKSIERVKLIKFLMATCRYKFFLQKREYLQQVPQKDKPELKQLLKFVAKGLNNRDQQSINKQINKLQNVPDLIGPSQTLLNFKQKRRQAKELLKNLCDEDLVVKNPDRRIRLRSEDKQLELIQHQSKQLR